MSSAQYHKFHLVDPSPWPISVSIGSLNMALGGVLCMQFYQKGLDTLVLGIIIVSLSVWFWWRDVIRESTYEGHHTKIVQKGLKIGMVLFIVTEVMFFFSFFWAYFHSSLAPSIEIGCVWPPRGIDTFDPWLIPLLNTAVLVLSGFTITWSHISILFNNYDQTNISLILTIILAIYFTILQLCEYIEANFDISDGIYGSVFFMSTGFHGFHVIIGTIFIIVCFFRHIYYHFTKNHHLGFECAAWYWHFVDVVWLFLFITIYWWGNSFKFNIPYFSDIFYLLNISLENISIFFKIDYILNYFYIPQLQ